MYYCAIELNTRLPNHIKMIKLKESTKIELWVVTGFLMLDLLMTTIFNLNRSIGLQQQAVWMPMLFGYVVTAICYYLLTLYVSTELEKANEPASNAVLLIYLFIYVSFLMGIISVYFFILLSIKMLVLYVMSNKKNSSNQLYRDLTLLFAISSFIYGATVLLRSTHLVISYFALVAPIAILTYLYSLHYLLPALEHRSYRFLRFMGKTFLLTLASFVPLGLLFFIFFYQQQSQDDTTIIICLQNFLTQLLIIPLFSWNVYKSRNNKKTEEIQSLKTELGKSDASLNFLKSQINPHFLFNALNTLYGTAIQEEAQRTSDGIQMLGDMMRFMLHENMEDKIPLSRDTEYLKNYIALQKLRVLKSADILIETQIEEQINDLQIAPMILIPFVENAFKHGISMQFPSHIRIMLQTSTNKLYFDVQNSIHLKTVNDPEEFQSGIGLENVKQRLALLYPQQHELIIRETASTFFIHLTIDLEEIK